MSSLLTADGLLTSSAPLVHVFDTRSLPRLALLVHRCTPGQRESTGCRAGCLSVRNRNLMVLARSKLRLASLTIGNTTTNVLGKPRITNQARAAGAVLVAT